MLVSNVLDPNVQATLNTNFQHCAINKVIGAQGLGALGDRTKQADRHEVPEESTTKNLQKLGTP